jgi:hypothetical protein
VNNILQVTFDGKDPREKLFEGKMNLTSSEFFKILDTHFSQIHNSYSLTNQSDFQTNETKKQRSLQSLMSIDCNEIEDVACKIQISDITFNKE